MFKIPLLDRWVVALADPRMIDELHKFSDAHVSFMDAIGEVFHDDFLKPPLLMMCVQLAFTKYSLGRQIHTNPHHVFVVREKFDRQLASIFPDVLDEMRAALSEFIPANTNGLFHFLYYLFCFANRLNRV